jgi:hypothetical protein
MSPAVRFVTVLHVSVSEHPVTMCITYHAEHGKIVSQTRPRRLMIGHVQIVPMQCNSQGPFIV